MISVNHVKIFFKCDKYFTVNKQLNSIHFSSKDAIVFFIFPKLLLCFADASIIPGIHARASVISKHDYSDSHT